MRTTKRILCHKPGLSFLMEEDLSYYILESGYPQMYIVIKDTPYEDPTMQHLSLSELSELLNVPEYAIEYGFSRK